MLNGCLAALNRFITRSTDKCKPFFQDLKKRAADFCWNKECEIAFQGLKRYLVSPLTIETYAGRDVVSLPRCLRVSSERNLGLRGRRHPEASILCQSHYECPQTRYQKLEKLMLALFIISRKLKHFFQTFSITILTEHPLWSIVENPEATGRISKWASEFRFYGIQ